MGIEKPRRKANTPASRKAKGRKASQEVRDFLLQAGITHGLEAGDIEVKPSGVTGEDLYLSPLARRIYPYAFEVKCQESLNFWDAIRQSEGHAHGTGHVPVVVFKRNSEKLRIILDFETFIKMTLPIPSIEE